MKRTKIKQILSATSSSGEVLIKGWLRTKRQAKDFCFLEINDGSCLSNIQVFADKDLPNYAEISSVSTGSAVSIGGALVESPGQGQKWEIWASTLEIIHIAPETYPLQKKRHTDEFLRTIAHLRPRTNKYGAAFRLRSEMAYAIHKFYKEKGFVYLNTPVITGSDCEGAGEMFRVSTLKPDMMQKSGQIDFSQDFFGQEANLTVSGQLSAEMFALALGDVYTFGPTFRAENSNTSRHAAEFWMLEPEMAFCDLVGNMDNAEELIKYLICHAMNQVSEDLGLFIKFVDKDLEKRLNVILNSEFARIQYAEAISILKKSGENFAFPVEFGTDLQSEHEQYLAGVYFQKPVFLTDYPREIKAFYMRANDDEKTVAAMDLLVPKIGELIGGSQREERLDVLELRMKQMNLPLEHYWWYLDSRRYGSVPHSGFGMGFERFLMMITGISNIRDVIPFPRTPGSIKF
jgi:asparaginyl-tRNA synthetase